MKQLSLILTGLALIVPAVIAQSAPDSSAKLLSMPEYLISAEASAAGIDGKIQVAVWIGKDGMVDRAEFMAGPNWPCGSEPRIEIEKVREGVIATVEKAKFSPAIKNGKPEAVAVLMTILIGQEYENFKKQRALARKPAADGDKTLVGGVINGKALSLPKPEYPNDARIGHAGGTVEVEVLIDEHGKIVRAGAKSGHPLLQGAARDAACRAKFSPTLLAGQPVKVSGILTYNFLP